MVGGISFRSIFEIGELIANRIAARIAIMIATLFFVFKICTSLHLVKNDLSLYALTIFIYIIH